jgi:hypothetical protein
MKMHRNHSIHGGVWTRQEDFATIYPVLQEMGLQDIPSSARSGMFIEEPNTYTQAP